jgi:hypothetical protein
MSPKWPSSPQGQPKATLNLTAEKNGQCNLGEQLKGKVNLCSDEEFDVKQLIVQLTCSETVKQTGIGVRISLIPIQNVSTYNNVEIYRDNHVLFGAARIPKGFAGTYSYAINIPAGAKETHYSEDHSVKWLLSSILEAVNRPYVQTPIYEIQVARPQTNQAPTIMMKEIKETTREIVLIQCSYCAGLMPQTSIFCPNCGARRKS